jgi:predicted permease
MRVLRVFESVSRALLRLAPECFRRDWQDELLATVRESCLDAHRTAGWRGLLSTGVLEMSNVGESALRARFGGGTPVTGGSPRRPDRHGYGKGTHSMQLLANDLRLAVRSLLAARTSVTIAILTLALGIGVNAAVFSILDSTVFRPVPFADAARYDEVWTLHTDGGFSTPGSRREVILEWRRQTDLFDRVEAYDITTFIFDSPAGAEMITGSFVTPGMLSMLGVQPVLGRVFTEGEGRGGTAGRVVISERLWEDRFLRDPAILERVLSFNGDRFSVVGVMPASFRFPNSAPVFWVPYDLEAPPVEMTAQPTNLVPFARRVPGLTSTAAAELVESRGEAVQAAGGAPAGRGAKMGISRLIDQRTGRSLYVLGGAVAFLLLIVCANLANLSLSRALTRTRDFAVRASLGASRRDLVRETLIEHLIIGVAGAALGLLVAELALHLTLDRLPSTMLIGSMNEIDLDGRALLFTASAGVFATLLFGLPPAWLASRAGIGEMLKQSSRATTGTRTSRRVRSALVVAEVALAIVLLVGAALMARSFVKLQSVDRGFDASNLLALSIGLPAVGYADPYARDSYTEALLDRIRKVPGVRGVTAGSVPPDADMISFGELEFADRPGEMSESLVLPIYQVWPDYFNAVGIPIRAGRPFSVGEPAGSVIVSESFAEKYFAPGAAVGSTFRFEGSATWKEVVGVAGEVRQLTMDDSQGSFELYEPLRRPPGLAPPTRQPTSAIVNYRTIAVRADVPAEVVEPVRQAVHREDPRVVIWELGSVEQQFADAVARPRIVLLLMSVFAGFGLVLAAAGIYGVLSYLVAERRREIGIRLALGAQPGNVGRLILGNGLRLTAIGLVLGVVAALGLVRVMRSLLYEVEPTDPASVAAVVAILLATAVVASWWPARRAMQVNPVTLLREE